MFSLSIILIHHAQVIFRCLRLSIDFSFHTMVDGEDDIAPSGKVPKISADIGAKRKAEDQGEKRQYLNLTKMEDNAVWKAFCKPPPAPYMTEFCDSKDERRGIGANRWIMSLLTFCQYQLSVVGKQHNNLILKPEVCKELYAEIEKVLPSLEYCLAPKKTKEASGAQSAPPGISDRTPV